MADVETLLKDPQFRALPPERREAILRDAMQAAAPMPTLAPGLSPRSDLTINIGGSPPDPEAPTPPTPGQTEQVRASIPPEFGGTVTNPPGLTERGVEGLLKYGPPALAASLTGGMSYPVQLGGQLAATWGQQLLGIEPRQGLVPMAETVLADLLGRGAFGAGRELVRSAVRSSPAGQQYLANQEREALRFRLDRQMEANELEQGQFTHSINQSLGRGRQSQAAFDAEADRAIGTGVQEQFALKRAADAALDKGQLEQRVLQRQMEREAGRGVQQAETLETGLKQFGRTVRGDVETTQALRRQTEEGFDLVKSTLVQTGDNIKRTMQFQRDQARLVRETAVTDARAWLDKYPVPSDATIEQLYGQVDKYNNDELPRSVLEPLAAATERLGATEARIAQVLPEAVNPRLQRMGRPAPSAGAAVPETAEQIMTTGGGAGTAPADLEIQKFLTQRHHKGRWGIKLSDDELFSEFDAVLGKMESGSARLKNSKNGLTTDEAAQLAHEQGFIDTPDKESLLRALDESVNMGRPVYSKFKAEPDFSFVGLTPQGPEEPLTFQHLRDAISRAGQKIGDARAGVNTGVTGAREELAAWSSKYAALQEALSTAETNKDLLPAAREALKEANAAFKIKATMEDLRGLFEAKMRTPAGGAETFNPGAVLDALRRPVNKDLRGKLADIGVLDGLETFLGDLQKKLAAPVDALRKARELEITAKGIYRQLSEDEKQAVQRYMDTQQAMQRRLALTQEAVGEDVAGIRQKAEAKVGMLQSQAETALEDAKRKAGLLTTQGAEAQQQAQARAEMLKSQGAAQVEQAEARAGMLTSEAQTAAGQGQDAIEAFKRRIQGVKTPSLSDTINLGLPTATAGTAAAVLLGSPRTGVVIGGAFGAYGLLVRAMMTPKGQVAVGKILEASGGMLTPASIVVLSQVAKDPMMDLGETIGTGIKRLVVGR